jgi:ankyrin repeat protein
MIAADYNRDSKIVSALLKGGADVSARDKDGLTALTLAVERHAGLQNILRELQEAVAETEGCRGHEPTAAPSCDSIN